MKSFLDFEEKNVEKAVQKACTDLNVTHEKLKYDIISHGSSGIFGLVGAKKALIRVFVPDLPNGQSISDASAIAGYRDKILNSDITQSEKDTVSALVDEAFGEVKEPVRIAARALEKPKKIKKPRKVEKPEKKEKTEKTEKSEISKTPIAATEDQTINSEAALRVAQGLAREVFEAMSIDAEMSVNTDSDQCWINVKVEEPGILIGKRGQTLEAIQYLVDKVVNKQCGKGNRVIFDVEGYVESRKSELKDLASRLASKAVKTGKPSTMTRMNAHDRRIVHVTLKRNRSVRTQSVGDGYYRKLIIFPKKNSQKKTDKAQSKK
ncbi:MAG: KH domain-containing protein [Desulfobacteraceae bacterium]|nr:Jag N-terminal domain-containing protein [Desulfobacteraceae bacterium]MBC2757039.1 KH domain-containing protein [Desulfobacteraceae bacterium]